MRRILLVFITIFNQFSFYFKKSNKRTRELNEEIKAPLRIYVTVEKSDELVENVLDLMSKTGAKKVVFFGVLFKKVKK